MVILAAGRSRRLGGTSPKACRILEGRPLFAHSLETALGMPSVIQVILVVPAEHLAEARDLLGLAGIPPREPEGPAQGPAHVTVQVTAGGPERPDSVRAALGLLAPAVEWVVVHDAARPFASPALFAAVLGAAEREGAATAAIAPADALRWREAPARDELYLPRSALVQVQTPQAFGRAVLVEAHEQALRNERGVAGELAAPDDASLVWAAGHAVALVPGEPDNFKITCPQDWERARRTARARADACPYPPLGRRRAMGADSGAEALVVASGVPGAGSGARTIATQQADSRRALPPRVGQGYDIHRLARGRPLFLAGVELPHPRGLVGHSDGDVACHALADALLGAAGLGDLGEHFPARSAEWKDAPGPRLLERVAYMVRQAGYEIGNLDVTILGEAPRVAPHRLEMREALARALGVPMDRVSVKAKTEEGLGPVGAKTCLAAHAIVLLLPVSRRTDP